MTVENIRTRLLFSEAIEEEVECGWKTSDILHLSSSYEELHYAPISFIFMVPNVAEKAVMLNEFIRILFEVLVYIFFVLQK